MIKRGIYSIQREIFPEHPFRDGDKIIDAAGNVGTFLALRRVGKEDGVSYDTVAYGKQKVKLFPVNEMNNLFKFA